MSMQQLSWNGDSPLARLSSKSNEWYTPQMYIEAARRVMGGIDLDPASCAYANRVVQAGRYFDLSVNGLLQEWYATSLWCNPPYGRANRNRSSQEVWTCKLIAEYEAGRVQQAVLLVNAATDTGWFQRLWLYPICFVNHRIDFYSQQNIQGGPTHGSVLVYFGAQQDRFIEIFGVFGRVVPASAGEPVQTLWEVA